jgi:hypothetical protein
MRSQFKVPPAAMVPVLDENGCQTGQWAINAVFLDPTTSGWTVVADPGHPVVKLVDSQGCVKAWAVVMVQAPPEA